MTHPAPGSWGPGRGRLRGNRGGYLNHNDRGFNHNSGRGVNQSNGRGYNQNNDRGFNQNSDRGFNQNSDRGFNQNGDRGFNQNGERGYNQNSDRGYNQNNGHSYHQNNDMCINQNRYNNSNQVYVPSLMSHGQPQPTNHTGHHLSFIVPQENVMYQPNVNTTVPPLFPLTGVPVFPFAGLNPNQEPGRFIQANEGVLLHMPPHGVQQNGHVPLQAPMEVQYPPLETYHPDNIEKTCVCEKCNCMNISAYIMINNLILEKKCAEDLLKSLQDEQQENARLRLNVENGVPFPDAKESSFRFSVDAAPFVESERYEPSKRWSSGVDGQDTKTELSTLYEPAVYYDSSDCQIVDSTDCEIVDSTDCQIVDSTDCQIVDSTSEHSVPVVSWADEEDVTPVADESVHDQARMADVVKEVEELSVSDRPAGGQRSGGDGFRNRGGYQGNRPRNAFPGGGGGQRGGGGHYSEQQGGRQQGYQNNNYQPRSNSSGRGVSYNNSGRGGGGGGGGGGARRNQREGTGPQQGRSDMSNWRDKSAPAAAERPDDGEGGPPVSRETEEDGGGRGGGEGGRQEEDRQRGGGERGGGSGGAVVFKELNGDLFTAPSDFSLAHCVAADMRMGSGIAVTFRSKFGRIGELLDQYKDVGEVAVLEENGRYLYYLVTKAQSWGKPTMQSLRRSLEEMKRHCVERNVTKLAMPRIGCGLDRLEWREVRALLEEVFAGTGLAITVYNFPQADDEKDVDAAPKKKAALYITHHKQSLVTIAAETGLVYFCSEETAENPMSLGLDAKHRFLQLVRTEPRTLGKLVRTQRGNEVFYGLVVKRRERDRVSYTAVVECLKQLRKVNDKDSFGYLGIEAFRDGKDRLATEKVVTALRNMFSIIHYRLEVWICWPEEIQCDHDWSLDAPTGGGK